LITFKEQEPLNQSRIKIDQDVHGEMENHRYAEYQYESFVSRPGIELNGLPEHSQHDLEYFQRLTHASFRESVMSNSNSVIDIKVSPHAD
jgi:hypothetical protein